MADPLRRTILAKLRGRRSKKGTALGGCGFPPNGDAEGKGDVVQNRDDAAPRAVLGKQSGAESGTMWGNASSFSRGVQDRGDSVVTGDSLHCQAAFMGFSPVGGSPGAGVDPLNPGARVNEESPGVSLQRAAPARGGLGEDTSAYGGHELRFGSALPARSSSSGKYGSAARTQYSVGDSIGFGTCESRGFPSAALRPSAAAGGRRRAADSARCREDPRSRCGVGPTVEGAPAFPELGQGGAAPLGCPDSGQRARKGEENIVIRTIESYGCWPGGQKVNGGQKVPGLQAPAFFPTELELFEAKEDARRRSSLGSQEEHEEDEEEEDYYDNEILPFYEEDALMNCKTTKGKNSHHSGSTLETDRLRTRLKEAYHLLINAMQDITFDGQVGVNGFLDHTSTSSHSQDSVCSQSSTKAVDSDVWSSGKNSPQQVSDSGSLRSLCAETYRPCLKDSILSKSSENVGVMNVKAPFRRSQSDGAIKYATNQKCVKSVTCQNTSVCGDCESTQEAVTDSQEKLLACDGISGDDLCGENRGDSLLNESGGSVNSLSGSSDYAEAQGNKQDLNGSRGISAKPLGVTVNKMQEWMHKGRVLSSEMKQRIAGSSSTRPAWGLSDWTKWTTQTNKSVVPCQGVQQSALIENVHSCSTASVEVRTGRTSDSRPSLNTITVSKKRNWLQQSSGKDGPPVVGLEGGHGQTAIPSLFPSEGLTVNAPVALAAPPKPPRLHVSSITVFHTKSSPPPRAVDPAEENDADDEGEIWYNPIPEDEEPEVPLAPHRRASAGDSVGSTGASSAGLESADMCQGGLGGEASPAVAVHSMELTQLHRQMFACKSTVENLAARNAAPDGIEFSSSGFSPPSSPNPSKKSSSINWSFPDKIKSPRTVRKLSMKMKKLPELSRKLSVKSTCSSTQPEARPLFPQSRQGVEAGPGPPRHCSRGSQTAASRNVISRYHLDSSVSPQHSYSKKKNSGGSKSASKGGYLSDGDSPELLAKSGKHGPEGKTGKSKEPPVNSSPKLHGAELDIDAFRHYCFVDQPKCVQYISGLMNLHFYGAEDLKPPRIDSCDVYCAIQVDSVNKARTALLTCRTTFLDMDHTFNIELENAQHLKLVVFSWEPTPRKNRVCCHGTVVLPTLFRVAKTHQLAVKLEPRGIIYMKLNLMEQWQNSLDGPDVDQEPQVFGVEAWKVVERENVGLMVPLIIEKCIAEIEKRGCQVVGLYRLCGSAAVKKELREAFERDSRLVELSENQYPDINVITGVLKDYLRELPYPLISKQLYEAVLDSMVKRPLRIGTSGNENDPADSEHTVGLLEVLPDVEKATLRKLLDHLKRVASHHEVNKMTCQNLAVCFGPVLLSQRQEASCHSNRVFIDSEELASALHFKKHIEVLHYLLQLWPVGNTYSPGLAPVKEPSVETAAVTQYLRRRRERPQVLNLTEAEMAGVLRPKPGRLDSPSNRYAGDWSRCGEDYLQPLKWQPSEEADYDDVPSEDTEDADDQQGRLDQVPQAAEESDAIEGVENCQGNFQTTNLPDVSTSHIIPTQEHLAKEHTYQAYMKIQEISPVLSNRVNLKDLQESIDTLIGNLERELNKNKLNVGY